MSILWDLAGWINPLLFTSARLAQLLFSFPLSLHFCLLCKENGCKRFKEKRCFCLRFSVLYLLEDAGYAYRLYVSSSTSGVSAVYTWWIRMLLFQVVWSQQPMCLCPTTLHCLRTQCEPVSPSCHQPKPCSPTLTPPFPSRTCDLPPDPLLYSHHALQSSHCTRVLSFCAVEKWDSSVVLLPKASV